MKKILGESALSHQARSRRCRCLRRLRPIEHRSLTRGANARDLATGAECVVRSWFSQFAAVTSAWFGFRHACVGGLASSIVFHLRHAQYVVAWGCAILPFEFSTDYNFWVCHLSECVSAAFPDMATVFVEKLRHTYSTRPPSPFAKHRLLACALLEASI